MTTTQARRPPVAATLPRTHLEVSHSARCTILVSGLSLALFAVLALLVRYGVLASADDRGMQWAQEWAPRWLHHAGRLAGVVGAFERQAIVVLALSSAALAFGRVRAGAGLLLLFSTTVVEVLVKRFLHFPRSDVVRLLQAHPSDLPEQFRAILPTIETAPFPSGHMARATFLLGLLFLACSRYLPAGPVRWLLQGMLIVAWSVMAVTRVVLGEHFPSDVLGGALLGLAALAPAAWLLRLNSPRD